MRKLCPSKTVIGLTGGIATGKSLAAAYLKKLGAVVVDSDRIAREVVKKGKPAHKRIVAAFGKRVLLKSGEVNRKKLGKIVFSSPGKRKILEEITHPGIISGIRKAVSGSRAQTVFVDMPLLFEAGLRNSVDRVLLVWAPEKAVRKRLKKRDGLSDLEVTLRLKSQIPVSRKKKLSHFVVNNSREASSARIQLKKIFRKINRK
ncbi:MAG: dephospho-CoA kinase [Endomicrobiales bacterium]|nr:dephospho-CoA kinase [Endomicrobiales bacterium]